MDTERRRIHDFPGSRYRIGGKLALALASAFLVFVVGRATALRLWLSPPQLVVIRSQALGRTQVGKSIVHRLSIRNGGRGELRILDTKTDCECVVAGVSRETIAPNEETQFEVVYTPRVPGERRQHVAIRSNDPSSPVTVVTLTADVAEGDHSGGVTQ